MNHPTGPYRNESCRALAERVNRGEAWRTLDVRINIDQILQGSKSLLAPQVLEALTDAIPFVLYNDTDNYCMVIPQEARMISVINNVEHSQTISKTKQEFANTIRLAIVAYDKFFRMAPQLEQPEQKELAVSI